MVLVYSRCTLECAYESATGNAKNAKHCQEDI